MSQAIDSLSETAPCLVCQDLRQQWRRAPGRVLDSLLQAPLKDIAWPEFHGLWCEVVARTHGHASAQPAANCLLDALGERATQPFHPTLSGGAWVGVDIVRYFPAHRERAWALILGWLGQDSMAHDSMAHQVGCRIALEAMLEDEGARGSFFEVLLDYLGPHACVGISQDLTWVQAWAQIGSSFERPGVREAALDLLLEKGASLDASQPHGRSPLECIGAPVAGLFTQGMVLEDADARIQDTAWLLLTRGAAWDHLEGRVPSKLWSMILQHPVARRAQLRTLACNNNAPEDRRVL